MLLLSSSLLLLPFMQKQKATNVNFRTKAAHTSIFYCFICCEFRLLTNLLQKVKASFLFVLLLDAVRCVINVYTYIWIKNIYIYA